MKRVTTSIATIIASVAVLLAVSTPAHGVLKVTTGNTADKYAFQADLMAASGKTVIIAGDGTVFIAEPPGDDNTFTTYLRRIIDSPKTTTVAVGRNVADVIFGNWSLRTIDLDDFDQLSGDDGTLTQAAGIMHELYEQFCGQVGGRPFKEAHRHAIICENGIHADLQQGCIRPCGKGAKTQPEGGKVVWYTPSRQIGTGTLGFWRVVTGTGDQIESFTFVTTIPPPETYADAIASRMTTADTSMVGGYECEETIRYARCVAHDADRASGGGQVDSTYLWVSTFDAGSTCAAQSWTPVDLTGFGGYAALHSGASLVQEDPCLCNRTCVWGFFDNPAVTNYACGGWPLQGAVPYGPDASGLYLNNEIWSPRIPCWGSGSSFVLEFDVYRNLPLDNLVLYEWRVRSIGSDGSEGDWRTDEFGYYGASKDWITHRAEIGHLIPPDAQYIQIALGVVDMCELWSGLYGSGACHSHAPLFDRVKVIRANTQGPSVSASDIDMFQDNFPEEGGIGPGAYARCDMAQDILGAYSRNILPGDSLKVVVNDPVGLATDATGGRNRKAVYVFVKVTDRFGSPIAGKNGLAIQSPDNQAYMTDPSAGMLRWPFVAGIAPAGWDAYRMDYAYTTDGARVKDGFCCDLMDLGFGPTGPHYKHANENVAANVGIFEPGDVIHYFLAAKNLSNQWRYRSRTFDGQGFWFQTNNVSECTASPLEWSVLPDAGRLPGDLGDILFVDDADDRGGPAQLYFDWAFNYLGLTNRVDRFDVLGPSSFVGNSLASRVKNTQNQIIGDPVEIYQKVLWNSSDLDAGLMGDGGTPSGGTSVEKSDDFGLCYRFLDQHPDNPGWAYWGDNVVADWSNLTGLGAVNVKSIYMNHVLLNQNQRAITGIISPKVWPVALSPWVGETFYAFGGCPLINKFDVINATGTLAKVSHLYNNSAAAPAAVYQATANAALTTARFHLAGFAYNFIRDDDAIPPLDRVNYLKYTLQWFQNIIGNPIGIDPVAFANTLEDNYPNPFNPTTTIKYSIAERGMVTLKIYNAAGQLVRTLVDSEQAPRAEGFSLDWNGTNNTGQKVSSGVYFYQLMAKNFEQTKKMVIIK